MNMRLLVLPALLLLGACGDSPPSSGGDPAAAAGPGPSPAAGSSAPAGAAEAGASQAAASAPPVQASGSGQFAGRTGELLNPDNETMVFLYYDLTGNPPPVDQWVQKDTRVTYAPAIEKAALREQAKAEIEAGLAAVRGAGLIRLSIQNANLSDYDPTYGEFTIRALSPSSEVTFRAFDQDVAIRFANGRTAQIWKVPPAEAQAIRDKMMVGGYFGTAEIEVLLSIRAIQPGPGGGTIITDVLEYELREPRSATTITRQRLTAS
jgi:hypothetical protein